MSEETPTPEAPVDEQPDVQPGPTGMQILGDRQNGQVIVVFERPVKTLQLTPGAAIKIANALMKVARVVGEQRIIVPGRSN